MNKKNEKVCFNFLFLHVLYYGCQEFLLLNFMYSYLKISERRKENCNHNATERIHPSGYFQNINANNMVNYTLFIVYCLSINFRVKQLNIS